MHKNAGKKRDIVKKSGTAGNLEPKSGTVPLKVRQLVGMIMHVY